MRTTQTPPSKEKTDAKTHAQSHTRDTTARRRGSSFLRRCPLLRDNPGGKRRSLPEEAARTARSESRASVLPRERPPSARLGGPTPPRQGLGQEASSRTPAPRSPVHAAHKFTARSLVSSLQPPGALALPQLAAALGRVRRAEAGAAAAPRRRAARSPGPRSLPPSCLRPGRPRPGALRSHRTNAPRVPAAPHTQGAWSPPRCRQPGQAGRRPGPGDAAREAQRRPGDEAATHLSPARPVFAPVSSAASPAPPHPP